MVGRPDDEPLGDAISAVLLGFNDQFSDRLELQHRLKLRDPGSRNTTRL